MEPLILWAVDRVEGIYVVSDSSGATLLGPFYSLRDLDVVSQRFADSLNRPLYLRHCGDDGCAASERLVVPAGAVR